MKKSEIIEKQLVGKVISSVSIGECVTTITFEDGSEIELRASGSGEIWLSVDYDE